MSPIGDIFAHAFLRVILRPSSELLTESQDYLLELKSLECHFLQRLIDHRAHKLDCHTDHFDDTVRLQAPTVEQR